MFKRARLLFCVLALASSFGLAARLQAGEQATGGPITETVEQIMARDRANPRAPGVLTVMREHEVPELAHRLRNPDAPDVSSWPPLPGGLEEPTWALPSSPQAIGLTFTGPTLADAGFVPPDSMGAVGPTQYVAIINGRIRSYDKTTGVADTVLNATTDNFFASVRNASSTSDPRIRYDRLSGKWFVVIINVAATNNRVLLAVSSGSTITNASNFTFYFFQHNLVAPVGDTNLFFDYPTLGIDANALYIGANMFTGAGAFQNTSGFVVQKSSVVSGGTIVVNAFRSLATLTVAGPYTPQGVDNFDPSATVGWFVGIDILSFSKLQFRKVTNPGSATPTISANLALTVPTTVNPITTPQLGAATGLDALDGRLFAAHLRSNHIWSAHNFQVNASGVGSGTGGRNGSRWYDIDVSSGSPVLNQAGTLYDSAATNPLSYWIPSVMVSGQGHMALGSSVCGAASHAGTAAAGRLVGDTLGTTSAPTVYQASTFIYNVADGVNPHRWGDFSYTCVDPDDDMTMWTVQEYCNAANSYAVKVAQLKAPPPATPSSASPNPIGMGQASISVVITGTVVSGSGFFDPGAGFVKRISASVTGGVVVNGITYTDPTHVTLDLSTMAASVGAQNVTITNPDGQTLTGVGILTICSAPSTTITAPAAVCANSIGNTASVSVTGGATYLWSITNGSITGGAGTASITWSASATSPVTLTAAVTSGSCSGSSSQTVTVNPSPTASASGTATICAGASTGLTGSGGVSCSWAPTTGLSSGTSCAPIATPASTTTYTLTVTGASGCVSTNAPTVTVTVNPLPTASATGSATICAGASTGLTGSGGVSCSWAPTTGLSSGTSCAPIATPASTTTYTLTVTGASGCVSTNAPTVTVTVNPLPTATITPSGATTFCAGGSVTLTASAGSSWLWSTGATTQAIAVTTSGTYSVTVTGANGCSATSAGTTVTVNPLPTATITPSGATTFCAGGSVTLTASAGSSWLWSTGATTQAIAVTTSGTYSVTVTGANGCSATSAGTTVTVNPLPVTPAITAPTHTTNGTTGNVASTTAVAGVTYAWTLANATITAGATTSSITYTAGVPGALMTASLVETSSSNCPSQAGTRRIFVDFLDTPTTSGFHSFIDNLAGNLITLGCGGGNYCPGDSTTRAQMAVFILRGAHGSSYVPPACTTQIFGDIPCTAFAAAWINEFSAEGYTAGCGNGNYCPDDSVNRASMSVFLLRGKHGTSYTPPSCTTQIFGDVPCTAFAAAWINELAAEGITVGCGNGNYCPTTPVTRDQMAVFIVRSFGLIFP